MEISRPCPMSWNRMKGTDARRHCEACRLPVHNLAALRRDRIESLLVEADGRVCVRVTRRPDGRLATADDPAWRRALRRIGEKIGAALAFFGLGAALLATTGCVTGSTTMGDPARPPPTVSTKKPDEKKSDRWDQGRPRYSTRPPE